MSLGNLHLIFAFIILSLIACSEVTPAANSVISNHEKKQICTNESLKNTSENFLNDLLKNDIIKSKQYYAKQYQQHGDGYGIHYTFFPSIDPNALFDIVGKNKESSIFVELMGEYQEGELVGFFQDSAKENTDKIEYLSEKHWKTFVVCNFLCIEGEWRISGQTCFEDSGSPFE